MGWSAGGVWDNRFSMIIHRMVFAMARDDLKYTPVVSNVFLLFDGSLQVLTCSSHFNWHFATCFDSCGSFLVSVAVVFSWCLGLYT